MTDLSSSNREELPELRRALQELSAAAQWVANQPNPRLSITGYSWFNVALDEVNRLGPERESVEEQARVAAESIGLRRISDTGEK